MAVWIYADKLKGVYDSEKGQSVQFTNNSDGTQMSGSEFFVYHPGTRQVRVTGSLSVSGTIYADNYNVKTITEVYQTGSTNFGNSNDDEHQFTGSMHVTADSDADFVALKLRNQSDAANTTGKVSLQFDLEDTAGTAVDSGKIQVTKEASFTSTAATQDSTMAFATSLNGTLADKMTLNSAGALSLNQDGSALKFGAGNDVTFTHDGGTGMAIASAGSLEIDSNATSVSIGTALADGQTLKLGPAGAVQTIIAPHGTAGSELYSVVNTAGTAANAIGLTGSAGGITLDAALDIKLVANGGNVTLHDGANNVFDFDVADPTLKIMDDADTGDYFSINVAAAGLTNISTVDDDGVAAHMRLSADGQVSLDNQKTAGNTGGGRLLLEDNDLIHSGNDGSSEIYLRTGNGTNVGGLFFQSGTLDTSTTTESTTYKDYNTQWAQLYLGSRYAGPYANVYHNQYAPAFCYRNQKGEQLNASVGIAYIVVNDSGSVSIGDNQLFQGSSKRLRVAATTANEYGVEIIGPDYSAQSGDLNALFVSGSLIADYTNAKNSLLINATCTQKQSGPLFTVSSSGQTTISTDMASDYPLQVYNDGDNANRYGIQIQAGADDASGQTFYINCSDGDGGNVGYIENNSTTFRLVDPSDKRLKKNIKDTKLKGLETVGKIKVRDFELKKNNISKTGFIAQELDKVYPSAVSSAPEGMLDPNGNPRMMGVSYEALVPLLIKAVQELSAEVKELKKKLDSG